MKRAIVWFRNDLRVTDNEALHRAVEESDEIIPVYIFDEDYINQTRYGARKFGARRLEFILESLGDLQKSLQALGGDLHTATGSPAAVLSELVDKYQVSEVFAQKEAMKEEVDSENAVREALSGRANLQLFHGHSLFHPDDIPFEVENIPDVFSNFRKKCEKMAEVRTIFPVPERVKVPEGLHNNLPKLTDLGFEHEAISDLAAIQFKGGEREARKRLQNYFWDTENLSQYKYTRNGLLGEDYSSKFSAWLAHGCISPRMIYSEVKRYEKSVKKNSSTYWMVFELIWRDYFRYVGMKFGNTLFYPGGIRGENNWGRVNQQRLDAWKRGETGVPFIDANMRELNETGFMSNRGRQNVASYLVKDLRQDWRFGAAYFEQELIDYDVTSNWGNWAYVAGVGNDPRENRYFNILTQASRYDEKGEYVKHWLPELKDLPKDYVHSPWKLSDSEKSEFGIHGTVYSKPVHVNPKW